MFENTYKILLIMFYFKHVSINAHTHIYTPSHANINAHPYSLEHAYEHT